MENVVDCRVSNRRLILSRWRKGLDGELFYIGDGGIVKMLDRMSIWREFSFSPNLPMVSIGIRELKSRLLAYANYYYRDGDYVLGVGHLSRSELGGKSSTVVCRGDGIYVYGRDVYGVMVRLFVNGEWAIHMPHTNNIDESGFRFRCWYKRGDSVFYIKSKNSYYGFIGDRWVFSALGSDVLGGYWIPASNKDVDGLFVRLVNRSYHVGVPFYRLEDGHIVARGDSCNVDVRTSNLSGEKWVWVNVEGQLYPSNVYGNGVWANLVNH